MRAIGYIRVSTQGQVDEGVSLAAQRAKIEAWCLAFDHDLIGIYEDAGISGTRSDRAGLQAALAQAGTGCALVVCSLSRLTRSTADMLQLADTLEKRETDLVSLTEAIDTTTAAGKMVFRILAVMNEFERDQISDRTKAALAHIKDSGEVLGAVPFGCTRSGTKWVEDEAETAIVQEIMAMRASGQTLGRIADDLNQRGIQGKRGGKWHRSTVNYLIKRQPC